MAANQKLRRENPRLVPTGSGYFLNGKIGISPQNRAFFPIARHFVGFCKTRLIFGAALST
ncbi:hypothetical protein [Pseudomonas brassicacearum]|uniref:hypothetical protein n=1 Tax=Pseudomonas brassicacearum TaxID=930166 RepID=UPI00160E6C4C|nr:hypothetical protein [Pseudomonas brassicacearum]